VYQIDSNTVYVPFDILQRDLHMTEMKSEDGSMTYPARTSEIDIRVKPGTDLNKARDKIAEICEKISREQMATGKFAPGNGFNVLTWEDSNRDFLGAVEHEEVLMLFLFGLISVVAVFLIFCIFYMIVVEKTRDIGIVKSVGATSGGVAGIFLGYGLAIGLVGAGTGFLFGWLVVHYINQLHAWLGRELHIVIWDPKVYVFDNIPNTMNPKEVIIICSVSVLAAVLGALVPAIRAASLHPVESLRWE
jgi:lipoprotein-releasing system permease protein